jgi:putative addiction module antidote
MLQEPLMSETSRENEAEDAVLKVRRIGDSLGLILPEDLLVRLRLKEGDRLTVVEQTEGGLKLSPYDPTHAKAMEIGRRAFRAYANTFKALAK